MKVINGRFFEAQSENGRYLVTMSSHDDKVVYKAYSRFYSGYVGSMVHAEIFKKTFSTYQEFRDEFSDSEFDGVSVHSLIKMFYTQEG